MGTIEYHMDESNNAQLLIEIKRVQTDPSDSMITTNLDEVGFDIFLLAGQSNISGSGGTPDPVLDAGNSRIFYLPGTGPMVNQIIPASEPMESQPSDRSVGVGPGLAFAREYLNHVSGNRKVLLIPTAVGGSSLVGGPWAVGGGYYSAALNLAKAAVGHAGENSRFAGILWVQGEGDAVGYRTEAQYSSAWQAMMEGFRNNIPGAKGCRIVVGGMVPEWRQSSLSGSAAQIHAAHTKLPSLVSNTFFVDGPAGYGYEQAPGIHYNAKGLRIFGQSMAKAMVAKPCTPKALTNLSATSWKAREVQLTWSRGTQSFPAVTGHSVLYKRAENSEWTTMAASDKPSAKVTGLTAGASYHFRVAAVNKEGMGQYTPTLTYTPPTTSALFGPAVRYDARTLSGAVHGTTVESWEDESGNGHTLSAPHISQRPVYSLDGMNGAPTVVFRGDEFMRTSAKQISSFATNGQFTAFVVTTTTRSPSGVIGMRTDGQFNIFNLTFDNSEYAQMEAFDGTYTNSNDREPAAQNVSHILTGIRSGKARLRVDGRAAGSDGASVPPYTGTSSVALSVGAITQGGFNPLSGSISFVAIYRGVLGDSAISTIEKALRADFNMPL